MIIRCKYETENAQVHLYMHNKAAAEQAHQLKDSCSKKIESFSVNIKRSVFQMLQVLGGINTYKGLPIVDLCNESICNWKTKKHQRLKQEVFCQHLKCSLHLASKDENRGHFRVIPWTSQILDLWVRHTNEQVSFFPAHRWLFKL